MPDSYPSDLYQHEELTMDNVTERLENKDIEVMTEESGINGVKFSISADTAQPYSGNFTKTLEEFIDGNINITSTTISGTAYPSWSNAVITEIKNFYDVINGRRIKYDSADPTAAIETFSTSGSTFTLRSPSNDWPFSVGNVVYFKTDSELGGSGALPGTYTYAGTAATLVPAVTAGVAYTVASVSVDTTTDKTALTFTDPGGNLVTWANGGTNDWFIYPTDTTGDDKKFFVNLKSIKIYLCVFLAKKLAYTVKRLSREYLSHLLNNAPTDGPYPSNYYRDY